MNVIYSLDDNHLWQLHALYQAEWWTKGRTITQTRNCVVGSQVCIGLTDDHNILKGFARILTDYTFKAMIFDLIVSADCRGNGLGDQLISLIKHHHELKGVRHFELYCLPELFSFYEKSGFSGEVGEIKLMRFVNH